LLCGYKRCTIPFGVSDLQDGGTAILKCSEHIRPESAPPNVDLSRCCSGPVV
jgi:hypothetical protein